MRRIPRDILILGFLSILRGVASASISTFLPLYALTIGMDFSDIGLAVTVANVVSVFSLPIIGWLIDAVSRKLVLMIAMFCTILSLALPAAFPSPIAIYVAYSLFYLSFFSWQPARGAVVMQVVDRTLVATVFASLATAFQVARVATPSIVGISIAVYGYRLVFSVLAMIMVLGIGLIAMLSEVRSEHRERVPVLKGLLLSIKPSRAEIQLYIILSIDRFGWAIWFPLLNPYLSVYLGLSTETIGFFTSLIYGSTIVALIAVGKFIDKFGWRFGMLFSEVFAAMGMIMLLRANTVELVLLAGILIGSSIAFWIPSYNVAVPSIMSSTNNIGRAYSRANMVRSLISIPAPTIGGALYREFPQLPISLGVVLMIVNIIILTMFLKAGRSSMRRTPPA